MHKWVNIFWWIVFITISIYLQTLAPGIDVLVVGVIILLQEEDYKSMLWLLPLFALLQEGIGTRPFGAMIIWYAAAIALFKIGRWLFAADTFLFVFLLSGCLGAVYFGEAWLLASLQDLTFNVEQTLDIALVQAIFMPFAWKLLAIMRNGKKETQNGD